MINPVSMAIAALTVMLWILWSDTIRKQRPAAILYAVRVALYIIVSAILVLNMVRYPSVFSGSARALVILTAAVGVFGAVYFVRKLVRRA